MAAKEEGKAKVEKIEFTPKQLRHVNRLRSQMEKAQQSLQDFAAYVGDEHDAQLDGSWIIGETGLERRLPPMPTSGDGQQQANGEEAGSEPPAAA